MLLAASYGSGAVWIALIVGAFLSGTLMFARLRFRYATKLPVQLAVRLGLVLGVIALGYAWFNPSDESTLAGVVSRLTFALAAIGLLCVQSTSDERALVFDVLRAARRRLGLAA